MDSPTPPPAPDPKETAAAQSAANKDTAIAQANLNNYNQVTPYGSLTYEQIGTNADGTPKFQSTTTLSPEQQKLYETGVQTQQNLGNIGVSQSQKIGDLLNTPFNVGDATESKIAQIQKGFLDPQWAQAEDRLKTHLINSGVRPGTTAYTRQMEDFSNNRQKGYDQSYLDAYNTAQQSALTERNQPINEISALLSGSQVSQPNFLSRTNTGIAPTDVIGAQQQSLNQQNVGYNAQMNQNNALMGGLFGLGKTALMGGFGGWG